MKSLGHRHITSLPYLAVVPPCILSIIFKEANGGITDGSSLVGTQLKLDSSNKEKNSQLLGGKVLLPNHYVVSSKMLPTDPTSASNSYLSVCLATKVAVSRIFFAWPSFVWHQLSLGMFQLMHKSETQSYWGGGSKIDYWFSWKRKKKQLSPPPNHTLSNLRK